MKGNRNLKYILAAVHGNCSLGKPIPIRPSAGNLQIIPLAELAHEELEAPLQHYSLQGFADASGVSLSTVKREVSSGRLKTFKLRGRRMVALESAMAYWDALRRCAEALEKQSESSTESSLEPAE